MSVVAMMTMKVAPQHMAAVEKWLKDETHHTREFDGCNETTIHRELSNPNRLLFLGKWKSKEHHEKYVAWRTQRGDMERLMGWLDGAPSASYFEVLDV